MVKKSNEHLLHIFDLLSGYLENWTCLVACSSVFGLVEYHLNIFATEKSVGSFEHYLVDHTTALSTTSNAV